MFPKCSSHSLETPVQNYAHLHSCSSCLLRPCLTVHDLFPLSSSRERTGSSPRDIFCFCSPTVNAYLSSAFVNKILSWGFFAFREHTGSSSGYMKTLFVARIDLLSLASFTYHVFKVLTSYSIYQYFIPSTAQ